MVKKTPPLSPEEKGKAIDDFYYRKPNERRNYPVADATQREQKATDDAIAKSRFTEAQKNLIKNSDELKVETEQAKLENAKESDKVKQKEFLEKAQKRNEERKQDADINKKFNRALKMAKKKKVGKVEGELQNFDSTRALAGDEFDEQIGNKASLKRSDSVDTIKVDNTSKSRNSRPPQPQLDDGEEVGRRGKPVKGEFSKRVVEESMKQNNKDFRGPS